MTDWPKWLYSREDARIFDSQADVPAGDWRESPAEFEEAPDEKAELIAALEAKGVEFDRRWGVAKLKALL